MGKLRYLNPVRIRDAVREVRRLSSGGGPRRLRLLSVGHPQGLIVPTSEVAFEVESLDGRVARFAPELPVPSPYAWAYRVARALGVPLVRSFEPEQASFEIAVPRRGGSKKGSG